MNDDELRDYYRKVVLNAIRFLALDYAQQRKVPPPFATLIQFIEEAIPDPIMLATEFEDCTGCSVFSKDERTELCNLRSILEQDLDRFYPSGVSGDDDTEFLRTMRSSARSLIERFGWDGPVDTGHL